VTTTRTTHTSTHGTSTRSTGARSTAGAAAGPMFADGGQLSNGAKVANNASTNAGC